MAHSFSLFAIFLCAFLLGSQGCNRQFRDYWRQRIQGCSLKDKVLDVVREVLLSDSFEVYAFNVGWYNNLVAPKFHLNYTDDTLALSTLTIPGVFKESFAPFICEKGLSIANDSWQKFTKYYMKKVQHKLMEKLKLNVPDKDILYAGVMLGPRHPAILVQTAGHVAGIAYYYQRKDIIPDAWPKNETVYGVSIHHLYGGWIYFGPVIIVEDVKCHLKKKQPIDALKCRAKKIELLNLANGNWRNQKWRNVINVTEKYTADYLDYRMAYGKARTDWVTKYYNENCSNV